MSESTQDSKLCQQVDEMMSELLEGDAPERLYDHLADCDRCRDARHDAQAAVELMADAGGDYRHPSDFVERVETALGSGDGATEDAEPAEASDGAPAEAPEAPAVGEAEAAEPAPGGSKHTEPGDADEIARAAAEGQGGESASEPAAEAEDSTPDPYADADATAAAGGEPGGTGGKVLSLLGKLRRPRNAAIAGAAVAALAAAATLPLWFGGGDGGDEEDVTAAATSPWHGKVARVSRAAGGSGGLQICDADGTDCEPAAAGARIEAGALLRTDDRTRVQLALADGTRVALDRSTELRLDGSSDRRAKLTGGALVADVAKVEGSKVRLDLPRGRVEVLGTKFALQVSGEVAAVDVSRGKVMLADEQDRSVLLRAGQEGRSYPGVAPYATHAAQLGEAMSWSESGEDERIAVRGLGELRAKKPGDKDERQGAVRLASHKVKVRIVDGFARTEVEEVFTNTTDEVLEGIYRFPLPPDGEVERLALEVNGQMQEGAFVDRDKAAAIWRGAIVHAAPKAARPRDEIIWVPGPWKDPALLEWQRGGRFELRIYPIPKKGQRKVVLAYTQVLPPAGGVRRYVYPLAHDPSGSLEVDQFDVDVQLRGHDKSFPVGTRGYALERGAAGEADSLSLHRSKFVPTGDLVIEYATDDGDTELSAWAYQPSAEEAKPSSSADAKPGATRAKAPSGDRVPQIGGKDDVAASTVSSAAPYLAMAIRPKLPKRSDDAQRAYVLVLDSSRSMYGERFKRASALAARLVDELDRLDRFTALACDTSCRPLPGGMHTPSHESARELRQFLDAITPEGASDPAAAVREAAALASHAEGRALRLVYIGDGTPTVGPIVPSDLTRAARQALPAGRGTLTAVAIGADADTDALGALARGGGGAMLPYVPGQRTGEAAYAILGASYGMGLSEVAVELPAGLHEVAPTELGTIARGGQALVVARMSQPRVSGQLVLRGKVGEQPFEQTYQLDVQAVGGQQNAFVPRLYAAERIAELERDGSASARTEAVALSSRFNVASRYSSLLVLESPAMFRAFGLDNTRSAPQWSGEMGVVGSRAKGKLALADDDEDRSAFGGDEKSKKERYDALSRDYAEEAPMGQGASVAGGRAFGPPPPTKAAPKPMAARKRPMRPNDPLASVTDETMPRRRRMVPMRRIYKRVGSIHPERRVPLAAATDKIAAARAAVDTDGNRRSAVSKLYRLLALSGDVDGASRVAERWSRKAALDPAALTARADVAARRGQRAEAIRILGSVIDVRPGDVAAQQRLARLHRWAGRPALGCRHSIAIAQIKQKEGKLLTEALRCGRATGQGLLVGDMLARADERTRKLAERLLDGKAPSDKLRGEIRLEASWQGGGADLDLALITPDGRRVSWLGAPTRAIISAEDVTSTRREALGLLGSRGGEYAIEVVRASGQGPVRGELKVRAPGTTRTIPFVLEGQRLALGTIGVHWRSELVPAW